MAQSLEEQYEKIYRYCYFKTGNQALAEDLTQEAFLRFFERSDRVSRGNPLAYLYTIARNLIIDAYRKKEHQPLAEDMADESDDIGCLETKTAVAEAVALLPADIQEVLLLRFANDLMINEISQISGLSRFAVRRKISSGLKELASILREEDFS